MNKIFLSGNLTRDPELKIYNSTTVAKCAIAVKGKNTDFFNITAFGTTAEFFSKWFSKGSRVIVEGRLQTNSYTDKSGTSRTSYDVIAENIEFADNFYKTDSTHQDVDLPF